MRNVRRMLQWGVVLLAPLALGCGAAGTEDGGPLAYRVSADPTVEILALGSYGGLGFFAPQYRLFGDGRLVREIVHKGNRQPDTALTDEVLLDPSDIELLLDLVIAARLPEMTQDGLQEAMGRRPLTMADGLTFVLELRFENYQRGGRKGDKPFVVQVKLHAPTLQLKVVPQLAEAQGMLALLEALDGYFPRSAAKVLYGPRGGER